MQRQREAQRLERLETTLRESAFSLAELAAMGVVPHKLLNLKPDRAIASSEVKMAVGPAMDLLSRCCLDVHVDVAALGVNDATRPARLANPLD